MRTPCRVNIKIKRTRQVNHGIHGETKVRPAGSDTLELDLGDDRFVQTTTTLKTITLTKAETLALPLDELEFQSFTKINTKIEAVKYKTHYSDVIILNNYFEKGLSMRKIAAKYNIAPSTVFRSIKKTKEKIRLEIGEDFEDYLNKEFELI